MIDKNGDEYFNFDEWCSGKKVKPLFSQKDSVRSNNLALRDFSRLENLRQDIIAEIVEYECNLLSGEK